MTIYTRMDSPLGELLLTSREGKLSGLEYVKHPHARIAPKWIRQDDAPVFVQAARELEEYFAGKRKKFDVKIDLSGTPFQTSVWNEINKIPFGKTITFGELTQRVGRPPNHVRAVGTATGHNPLRLIVPCHRVVGKDDARTGRATPHKGGLLDFEAAISTGRASALA